MADENVNGRVRAVEGHRTIYRVLPDTGDNETAGAATVLRILGPGRDRAQR